jgi:hypothetical protein
MLCSKERHPRRHLPAGEVAVAMVDRLELAAVDGDGCLGKEVPAPAQYDELAADVLDRCRVLRAEVGERLEVRRQAPDEPHQLEVAVGFPLKSPRRLDPVEVAVQVDFEHRPRVIGGAARCLRLDSIEAEAPKIERLHESIDHSDRIFFGDVFVDAFGQHGAL